MPTIAAIQLSKTTCGSTRATACPFDARSTTTPQPPTSTSSSQARKESNPHHGFWRPRSYLWTTDLCFCCSPPLTAKRRGRGNLSVRPASKIQVLLVSRSRAGLNRGSGSAWARFRSDRRLGADRRTPRRRLLSPMRYASLVASVSWKARLLCLQDNGREEARGCQAPLATLHPPATPASGWSLRCMDYSGDSSPIGRGTVDRGLQGVFRA